MLHIHLSTYVQQLINSFHLVIARYLKQLLLIILCLFRLKHKCRIELLALGLERILKLSKYPECSLDPRVAKLLPDVHLIVLYSLLVMDQLNLTPNELHHYLYVSPTYSNLVKLVGSLLFVKYLYQRLQNLLPHQENRPPYLHHQCQHHHQIHPFCQPIKLEYYHDELDLQMVQVIFHFHPYSKDLHLHIHYDDLS